MKKTVLLFRVLALILTINTQVFGQTQELSAVVYFGYDDHKLTPENIDVLRNLVKQIPQNASYEIEINGHTDQHGNQVYNLQLSEKRIAEVSKYLTSQGIDSDKISGEAHGKMKLHTSKDDPEYRKLNRRVEIVIRYTLFEQIEEEIIPADTNDILTLYKQLRTPTQEFIFDVSKDTAFRCQNGAVLYFRANSFKTKGLVKIQVKESFSNSEIIMENLSTTSRGQILETQGMLFVTAFDEDSNELSLRPGMDYVAFVPVDEEKKKMQIFIGKWDNRMIDWIPQQEKIKREKRLRHFKKWSAKKKRIRRRNRRSAEFMGFNDCYLMEMRIRTDDCPFFFCKIRSFINPKRKKGKSKKARYRCELIRVLQSDYGISNMRTVYGAMNQKLMDSLGVKTVAELNDTLDKIQRSNMMNNLKDGKGNMQELGYLVFANQQMKWANIDEFMSFPPEQLIAVRLPIKTSISVDAKLIFKKRRVIYPAADMNGEFGFAKVLKDQDAILVALSYTDGIPKICIRNINTSDKISEIAWQTVSVEQLKDQLKILDN
jgi:hypothetical protein